MSRTFCFLVDFDFLVEGDGKRIFCILPMPLEAFIKLFQGDGLVHYYTNDAHREGKADVALIQTSQKDKLTLQTKNS